MKLAFISGDFIKPGILMNVQAMFLRRSEMAVPGRGVRIFLVHLVVALSPAISCFGGDAVFTNAGGGGGRSACAIGESPKQARTM